MGLDQARDHRVTPASNPLSAGDHVVILGLGVTGRAVAGSLVRRGIVVTAVEDRPTDKTRSFVAGIQCAFIEAPTKEELRRLLDTASAFMPSPGIPESHDGFALAAALNVRTLSEFDLARWWDDRPIAAVTGTDGKTSVTLLTVAMLEASGIAAVAVGNTDTPLVEVIDDPSFDVFVVEASSFRLGHSERFSPNAAAWINFSPDHLDVHATLEGYEAAKAKIWEDLPANGLAVAPDDDPVVRSHLPTNVPNTIVGLDSSRGATAFVDDGRLLIGGVDIAGVDDLVRSFDHDITNALIAASLALHLGANVDGIAAAIGTYEIPPHRIQHVVTSGDISFYNDSKATVPHAVVTAVRAFSSVILLAGGRNKGLDLSELRSVSDRTRAVVAMGDAAAEVEAAFAGAAPVERAAGMDDAVRIALSIAQPGDVVLLSPGCTSFDAYPNYGARGNDFIRAVHELVEVS
ncbi:MAG: UDP-N-acetylmuramoylalanine--D-glutamate ligase [Verrucomicrobiales bacterium]